MSDEAKGRRAHDPAMGGPLDADDGRYDDRREEDEWERMIAAFRQSAPRPSRAPDWLETRVMGEIEALPREGAMGRAVRWLVRPAPIRISPLAGIAIAALFVLVILPHGRAPDPLTPTPSADGAIASTTDDRGTERTVFVQFVLEAPSATSVAVAGDFSEWQPAFSLEDVDGDGVWTGRVPVQPGVHTYMFLIDGTTWQTDPRAERYADDGFGNRNAVLAVAAGT